MGHYFTATRNIRRDDRSTNGAGLNQSLGKPFAIGGQYDRRSRRQIGAYVLGLAKIFYRAFAHPTVDRGTIDGRPIGYIEKAEQVEADIGPLRAHDSRGLCKLHHAFVA